APQLPAVPAPVLARLLSTRVAGRALRVRVTCRPRLCTGTIVLRAASGRGTVRLGSVKYRVAHGAPRTLKVALGTTALRAIARAGRKGALVSVEIHGTKQAWTSGEGGRVRP
ncbi:MAG: hypothetical protein JWQ18_3418, partial [Conexibacter sp.]|nr:hypothetical protein [Conexibacter sp.]